jgi:hypothetical protein
MSTATMNGLHTYRRVHRTSERSGEKSPNGVTTPNAEALGFYGPAPMHARPHASCGLPADDRCCMFRPASSTPGPLDVERSQSTTRGWTRFIFSGTTSQRQRTTLIIPHPGLKLLKQIKPLYPRAKAPGLYGLTCNAWCERGRHLTVNGHGTDESMNGPGVPARGQEQRAGHNPHQAL